MAAVTGSLIIAAGMATYQIVNAEQQKKKARQSIESFEQQELENPYSNIQISRESADQQTQANLSSSATSIDALQRGGARTVLGGVPRINEQNILLQNMISSDLDMQDKERQRLIAQGEGRLQEIQENREQSALLGYGQQMQTARQDLVSGVTNLVGTGLAFGTNQMLKEQNQQLAQRNDFSNLNIKPAFTVQNAFVDNTIPNQIYDNASLFENNPLIRNA